MGQVDVAAIKLGLRETDDEAKKALVATLTTNLKGQADQVIEQLATEQETGADILSSEMVPREEFEMFKAEVLALIQPLLGAVETLPTPDETQVVVEEVTTAKLDDLLRGLKSKVTAPSPRQSFEQPTGEVKQDWSVYDARKKEIANNTKR